MTLEFTIDLIEEKKDLFFVTGIALSDIARDECFNRLYQYGNSKKSKKQVASIELTIETIIVEGEPVDSVIANTLAMIALSGDFTAIETQAEALRWRKKGGRLIRTSDVALTLAQDS